LPPGRAKLVTSPTAIGSATAAITIGMVAVACFAARAHGVIIAIRGTQLEGKVSTLRIAEIFFASMGSGLFARFGTTPLPQKLTIAPIFIADSVSLAVLRKKDGKLRIVYAGWDNASVVQPDGYGQARRGWRRILPPTLSP